MIWLPWEECFLETFTSNLGSQLTEVELHYSGLILPSRIVMVNGNCVLIGCRNSNYRLKQRKKKDCSEHKDLFH